MALRRMGGLKMTKDKYAKINLKNDALSKKAQTVKAKLLNTYYREGTLISETLDSDTGFTTYIFKLHPVKPKKSKPVHPGIVPWYTSTSKHDPYYAYRRRCEEVCKCQVSKFKKSSTASKDHAANCPSQAVIHEGGFV